MALAFARADVRVPSLEMARLPVHFLVAALSGLPRRNENPEQHRAKNQGDEDKVDYNG